MEEESRASRGRTGNESYRGWSPGSDCEERDGEEREVRERKGRQGGTCGYDPDEGDEAYSEQDVLRRAERSASHGSLGNRISKGLSRIERFVDWTATKKFKGCILRVRIRFMFCYGMDSVLRDQV